MFKMYKTLQKHKPDVLHVTADGFSHMFALVGLMLGIPVLGSFHTDLMDLLAIHNAMGFQKMVVNLKEQLDSLVLDSCATTSLSFAAKLKRRGIHCDHVIITAVDTGTFSSSKRSSALRKELIFGDASSSSFLCVYVGRISKEKRLDVIVEAVKNTAGAYLAIIGDGPGAASYAGMHGKESRIYCKPRFLSHVELAEVYASSDLHVSASQFETLGNTVLEAFACGLPVVVPRCQGFQDTVEDTVNGYLFVPGSSSSAQTFIQLLKDDPVKRAAMGEHGRKEVSTHTASRVVSDLICWYQMGLQRRLEHRSTASKGLALILLLVTVPIAIFLLNCYDLLMDLLLAVCGYSPTENHPTAQMPSPRRQSMEVKIGSEIDHHLTEDKLRNGNEDQNLLRRRKISFSSTTSPSEENQHLSEK
eukprot:CAMPEP_0119035374 /NCGR_PEP_ID=MMETSP1177-20130426/2294_1 /TAXON_ID=2985 /ORGANISM="Ochromonas sp, Strain CCMP1899" /LENGTH=416 /DNA_ID=CAMNT_0006993463 /DNA_START=524 /DNA_END=1774 /DNA_ORIENTATION=+